MKSAAELICNVKRFSNVSDITQSPSLNLQRPILKTACFLKSLSELTTRGPVTWRDLLIRSWKKNPTNSVNGNAPTPHLTDTVPPLPRNFSVSKTFSPTAPLALKPEVICWCWFIAVKAEWRQIWAWCLTPMFSSLPDWRRLRYLIQLMRILS